MDPTRSTSVPSLSEDSREENLHHQKRVKGNDTLWKPLHKGNRDLAIYIYVYIYIYGTGGHVDCNR